MGFKSANRVSRVHVPENEMFRGIFDGSFTDGDVVASYTILSYRGRLVYQNTIREGTVKSEYAELLAIRMLLQNAIRLHVKHIEIVNDSKSVVDMVNHADKLFKGKRADRLNRHLSKVREMMNEFDYIMIEHKARKHTIYSDSLCRLNHEGISVKKTGGVVDFSQRVLANSI